MPLTLLLDLDDTLLRNVIHGFIPAYLQALGSHLNERHPEQIVRHVLKATQCMIAKRTPGMTMEQVFDDYFYPSIGTPRSDLEQKILQFYREVFPTLQPITSPAPEATAIIDYAFKQGWKVVIATNPLFPRTATLQRLDWAGLPIDRYPFDLVTTYEGMHFCKPSPEYYAETLAQIGWPEQPIAMIGNSLSDDILPASIFHMPAFWLDGNPDLLPAGLHPLSHVGNASEILPWLKTLDLNTETLEPRFDSPAAALGVLKSTPAALETMIAHLSDDKIHMRPMGDEWSITEILCHLRDVDQEVNLPRMDRLCVEENPFLPGVVTDPWAEERQYRHQNARKALQSFLKSRSQLASMLESIPQDQWKRTARHAIFGPTTLQELVGFIVTHDQVHIRQVQSCIQSKKA